MEMFANEVLTVDVGARLRQLRTERGKSMRALARASTLSTNALSMIERGRTSPSVSTLYKLAEALEVPITAFFRLEPPRQAIVFRRASDRKRVPIPNGMWEGLGGESFTGRMEPFMLSLDPNCGSGPFGMMHTGNEFVICITGQVEYEVDREKFILNQGDTLLFSAQYRHKWRNASNSTAQLLVVLAGFEQGERPSEFHIASGRKNTMTQDDLIDEAEALDLEDEF
jgi:transcriptional regulator with XRE-family HTH domain